MIAYLNGKFVPLEDARISPLDRGFLFADGVYEGFPFPARRAVGFAYHVARLDNGLRELGIAVDWDRDRWAELCDALVRAHWSADVSVYVQVTRGCEARRSHAIPDSVRPTIFAFAFDIPAPSGPDPDRVRTFRVSCDRDCRWRRCDLKTIALVGNVLHFDYARRRGTDEALLFDERDELTEASTSNVFVVKNGCVFTPPTSHRLLPGVTRRIVLEILRSRSAIRVEERPIGFRDVVGADEIWLTSSSKEIVPVVEVDGHTVGDGRPGPVWLEAQRLFTTFKYEF